MKLSCSVVLVVWTSFCWVKIVARTDLLNITAEQTSHRNKRFLIYEQFGTNKFIAGFAIPVLLYDKKPWRSLSAAYNLQGQYSVPQTPLYWWDKWEGRSLEEARLQFDKDGTYVADESRIFVYTLIESYMSREGRNGKQCLLRAICENAIVDETDSVWDEILRVVLTPTADTPDEYRDALKAGRYGMNCLSMFQECPMGQGMLDGIAHTVKIVSPR